jgi:branched-chain amino acid transport system permease protein
VTTIHTARTGRRVQSTELAVLALLMLVPVLVSRNSYHVYLGSLAVLYAGSAIALTLVLGVARQFHLGQAALMGIGGYVAAILAERWHTSVVIELVVAVLTAGAVGLVVGAATLRLKGLYLALATLALVLGQTQIATNLTGLTHGDIGFSGIASMRLFSSQLGQTSAYLVMAALLLAEFAVVRAVRRSTYWTALEFIGDYDHVAGCVGINVYRYKLALFVAASGAAAAWGVMYAHTVQFVNPDTFGLGMTVSLLMMVVLGGLGSVWGAVVGAIVLVAIPETLAGLRSHSQLIYGGILLAAILVFPKGLVPSIAQLLRTASERLARRRSPGRATESRPQGHSRQTETPSEIQELVGRLDGATLQVEDVACRFGGVRALDGASLTVERGTIEALIGPNGSGKTTLLNCVSGIFRPNSGSILFDGTELVGRRPDSIARLGLARTFQTPQCVPELTGIENAVIGLHPTRSTKLLQVALSLPKAERETAANIAATRQLCRYLSLSQEFEEPASELSTGERRFIEIARALGARPRLLFLDEPAAGLTSSEREHLISILDWLRSCGLTIVVIDHDIEFVFEIADHVTVLDHGGNIAAGAPEEIRRTPAVIEAYFGAPVVA